MAAAMHVHRWKEHPHYDTHFHYGESDSKDAISEIRALDNDIERQLLEARENGNKSEQTTKVPKVSQNADDSSSEDDDSAGDVVELKFTRETPDSSVSRYKRRLKESKVFKFSPKHNVLVHLILVSITENYHPQYVFSELTGSSSMEMTKPEYTTRFACVGGKTYVLEIGTNPKFSPAPFPDKSNGAFIAVLSSETQSIRDLLADESIRIGIHGYEGMAVFDQKQSLRLYMKGRAHVNHGDLDYFITPFYSRHSNSIMLYYRDGVDNYTGTKRRSTVMEVKCNEDPRDKQTYIGKEPKTANYVYVVDSKRVCPIISLMKSK